MIETLKWIASALFLFSALLISSNIVLSKWGYVTFFIGHIIFIYCFYKTKDIPMIFHNIIFGFIDIFGIYRWFFS